MGCFGRECTTGAAINDTAILTAGFGLSSNSSTQGAVFEAVSKAVSQALAKRVVPPTDTAPVELSTSRGRKWKRKISARTRKAAIPSDQSVSTDSTATGDRASFRSSLVSAPSIAFVSADSSRDIDEVRAAFVRALPKGTPIHGITSAKSLLVAGAEGGSIAKAVGILVIYANTGSKSNSGGFATSFDAEGNGTNAAVRLKEKMSNPQAIIMSTVPGLEEGILAILEKEFPSVPVYGGTAADNELAGKWSVLSAEASSNTGVSLVGIGHDIKFGASMMGPYKPTEKKAIATKTEGRKVFEIDGQHADDWVYDWLGEEVKEQFEKGGLVLDQTARHPIGIRRSSGEFIFNHLASFGGDDDWKGFESWTSWVEFFAPIPQGSELIVMDSGNGPSTGYKKGLVDAFDAAKSAKSMRGSEQPVAGILIFCGGMAIATADSMNNGLTGEEFASRVANVPLLGMTCFGEQGHLPKAKENVQRNLSTGMILFG